MSKDKFFHTVNRSKERQLATVGKKENKTKQSVKREKTCYLYTRTTAKNKNTVISL